MKIMLENNYEMKCLKNVHFIFKQLSIYLKTGNRLLNSFVFRMHQIL